MDIYDYTYMQVTTINEKKGGHAFEREQEEVYRRV